MKYDPERQHRRSIRLAGFDYACDGAYFVTICTRNHACLFGGTAGGEVLLSEAGHIAADCWLALPAHFPRVILDAFVVMPNHVHGIIVIHNGPTEDIVGARHGVPLPRPLEAFGKPVPGSLATIIRQFKAAVTRQIADLPNPPGGPVWQRNYYEHVIRDDADLDRIRQYIEANPARWDEDQENPAKGTTHP